MDVVNWIKLNDHIDIGNFINLFGVFHDSFMKELYIWTETFVDEDLSMNMSVNLVTCVRVLFQRQNRDSSAIELLF